MLAAACDKQAVQNAAAAKPDAERLAQIDTVDGKKAESDISVISGAAYTGTTIDAADLFSNIS